MIYKGDTPLIKLHLKDTLGPVNLSEGTVKIVMVSGGVRQEKTPTITDAANGKCELQTLKTDLLVGKCELQPIISYSDGREFAFSSTSFNVESRI